MKWFLPVISAILLGLSFEKPYLWWIALFGLTPFLIFLEKIQSSDSDVKTARKRRDALLGGWLFGFVFFALIFRWVLYSFPGDWAGLHNSLTSVSLFGISWLMISIVVGFSFALFGFLALRFGTRSIFVIPSIWALSEYLRAWLFSLFSWGPGGSLGPHWTFGNLGYALIDTPAILWSRVFGLYGASFIAVFINVLIFRLVIKRNIRAVPFLISVIILFFLPKIIFVDKQEEKLLNVALVHTEIKLGFLGEKNLILLLEEAKKSGEISEKPDIVVFPEGARLFASDNAEKTLLERIFPDKEKAGLIITSDIISTKQGLKEQIIYRDQQGKLLSIQDKSFLIPAGEYLPLVLKGFITFFQDPSFIYRFDILRTRIKGKEAPKPVPFGDTRIGTILCSGITSPLLYRSLSDDGAEILVNSASQIIFKNRSFFLSQVKTMARFQAIGNARPFLQASNGGQSFLINSRGKIVAETASFKNQILFVKVSPSKDKTFHTRFGDWPFVIGVLVLIISTFRSRKFR